MTVKELKQYIRDVFFSKEKTEYQLPYGKLDDKHKLMVKMVYGNDIDHFGEDLYCIGDNVVVGEETWNEFHKKD